MPNLGDLIPDGMRELRDRIAQEQGLRQQMAEENKRRQEMVERAGRGMAAAAASFRGVPDLSQIMKDIGPSPMVKNVQENQASEFYKRLTKMIQAFDESLDPAFEVGVRLVSFGETVVFHLDSIGYWNPSLISFAGKRDGGEPVELIQHVSQISVLLMKLPRAKPDEPKRPFGFQATTESAEESTEAPPVDETPTTDSTTSFQ